MPKDTVPCLTGAGVKRRGRGRPAVEGDIQRKKILAAATRLFIAEGFSGTTLDMVGKVAGITKRTIYKHVGNKEELFRVVCKERLPLGDRLKFDITLEDRSLQEVVMAIAREILRHAFAPEAIALERALTIESMRFPRLVQEVIDDGMGELNQNIAEVFDELVRRDRLPPMDLHRAADFFYDVVIGNRIFRMTMGHDEAPPDDEELAQRADMFIHGHLMRLPASNASR